MLGICFLEKGQPKQAIEWFEKGLGVAGRAPDEYRGLKYDLASAYEADGQKSQALDLFTALLAEDAKFRDVAKRVAQLHGSRR
jgi:tetratricopeptide (TPR) repeat protein